jgi:16S rRNA (guanine966-N2)-methyltransferase
MNHRNSAITSRRRPPDSGRFRIIGGRWRGRRLDFPAVGGVRPTGDRVRETLFNWLQPLIGGARCLDLYAGSGALGLEALSRGAGEVVFVDRHPALISSIDEHLGKLDTTAGRCFCLDADRFLHGPSTPFDVVFLDPPFGVTDWSQICTALWSDGWLKAGARVYMEDSAAAGKPAVPDGWALLRSARAGNVGYHLAAAPERGPAETAEEE